MFRGWKKNLISREINKDESERERESELGQEGKNICMWIQEEATHQPKPSCRRREWWCVRVWRPPSTHHLPFFFWLMLFRLFLVLRILSLTVSLSLCFTLLWDCVGLRKHKVPLLNEKNTQFYSLKYNLK